MTISRSTDFSLINEVRKESFTPRVKDLSPLLTLWCQADKTDKRKIEHAILRIQDDIFMQLESRFSKSIPDIQTLICRLVPKTGGPGTISSALSAKKIDFLFMVASATGEPKLRRAAITSLGLIDSKVDCGSLLAILEKEPDPSVQKILIETIGKIGELKASSALQRFQPTSPLLTQTRDKALLMLTRQATRGTDSQINLHVPIGNSFQRITLYCRHGLEKILAEQVAKLAVPCHISPGAVQIKWDGPLSDLLAIRTFMNFGFSLKTEPGPAPEAIATILTKKAVADFLVRFTIGPIKIRFHWENGGHQRSLTWACAQNLAARSTIIINDPKAAAWDILLTVSPSGELAKIELRPKRWEDPRFAYRQGFSAAGSHPTIAAALAYLAGTNPEKTIWDPFVGSGLELIERAKLGSYERVLGSDLSETALSATANNFSLAGIHNGKLVREDARKFRPNNVSLIISNPPMGRRLVRRDLKDLLTNFIKNAANVLKPGGRLVWISPLPQFTIQLMVDYGLTISFQQTVDLGGFTAEIQCAKKN